MKIKLLFPALFLALSLGLTFTSSFAQSTLFVFIKIPESIEPLERGEKYEDPINQILMGERAGEVTGGGSMLSAPAADGSRDIEWVGVDVDLVKPKKGIEILKRELVKLGAPLKTVLEIHRNTGIEKVILNTEGWQQL